MGRSLIGKMLNQGPPVPMSGPTRGGSGFLDMTGSGSNDEAYLRAYGEQGTVFANVSLLAAATAKPEWRLYRKAQRDGRVRYTTNDQGSDQRTEVLKHQALTVLQTPSVIQANGQASVVWTRFALFELSQLWMETTGKSHWVVQRDPRATFPTGLWPVRPDRMAPVPDRDNYLKGWLYTAPDGQEKIPLRPDEVIYNRYPDPSDPYGGLGPVRAILTDIQAAKYAAEWNRNFFVNSAVPGGVIQVDHRLDDDEWNELTNRWRESHRGVARAHRVAVLEAGATWVPNSMTVRDMDFANLRESSRDIIREGLGMHKVMTGVSDDVNRANAQTGEEVTAAWKIAPRLDRWKDVLNYQFLPLFGSTGADVEFDYIYPRPINREQDNAELKTKAEAAQALVNVGYDPHAVLEVVGLPDMEVVEQATQQPALPPGWVPGQSAEPDGDEPAAPSAAEVEARLRRMLSNGHRPVGSLR